MHTAAGSRVHHAAADAPTDIRKYSTLHLAGDVSGIAAALGMRDWAVNMMRLMPGSPMPNTVLLDDCGHWAAQERPEQVNELLLDFLAKLPGTR